MRTTDTKCERARRVHGSITTKRLIAAARLTISIIVRREFGASNISRAIFAYLIQRPFFKIVFEIRETNLGLSERLVRNCRAGVFSFVATLPKT